MTDSSSSVFRIFIVDDHPLVRRGLSELFQTQPDLEVCGLAEGVEGTVEAILKATPDLILMDVRLKDGDGLSLTRELRKAAVSAPILILSMCEEVTCAQKAVDAGAQRFLMKGSGTQVLEAVTEILGMGKKAIVPTIEADSESGNNRLDQPEER